MTKKVLIIITERDRGDMGRLPDGSKDIPDGLCHVTNLIEKVAALDGVEVETLFYADVTPEAIDAIAPEYVIGSGRLADGPISDIPRLYEGFLAFLRSNTKYPYLGICFGHQLLGVAFGVGDRHMCDVGKQGEHGYTNIEINPCDRLFRDLKSPINCMESHGDEIDAVPEDFTLIAWTDACCRNAIAHKTRPVYGLQFHPEFYNDEHPDGKVLLENFLELR